MKLLRAYWRLNTDIWEGLTGALRRWPWLAVPLISTEMLALAAADAPLWLQVWVGAAGGLGIFYLFVGEA